ncbi:NAD-dependent epimerase/dehydratase family protein [Paenibacillus segetis]|uniref:UDP-glucose 4-epimerase n=1 Tax=Paenibacillus segetis TaxID=1325360 RepID=A0ABQ1YT04_9BACL|nr:NAD-dependent epimerase/dehydratase family protein [Paenibacillus segetis]GGH37377.1 UDP-glucose 4-epimerase [Paenibacillus segetis]
MKVLVTGGAGFIGRCTVNQLIGQGDRVVVVDCTERNRSQSLEVEKLVTYYKVDITCDIEKLESIFAEERPDYVIHLAAQVSVRYSLVDPVEDADCNVMGTINVLKQCVRYGVKKFVFSSSAATYGNPKQIPIEENHETEPLSFYGLSKRVSEMYIQSYSHHFGLDYTILRYANVYGIRDTRTGEDGVVTAFVERILGGIPLEVYGDGQQTRDFIYVKDIAEANIAALRGGSQQIMNISSGKAVSLLEVIETLKQLCDASVTIQFLPHQKGDIEHSVLDNSKARSLLWWNPTYSLSDGLREIVNFENEIRRNPASVSHLVYNKIPAM